MELVGRLNRGGGLHRYVVRLWAKGFPGLQPRAAGNSRTKFLRQQTA